MPARQPLLSILALAALALTLLPGRGLAQELTGKALGPGGAPLDGTAVVLHRVGGGSGAFVGTDTTSAEGEFRFTLPPGDSAIYFAALRYDDRMYIGPAVQAASEPVRDYLLRVEPGSEVGAVATALGGRAPASTAGRTGGASGRDTGAGVSDAGALLLVGLLAVAAVGAFLVAAPRHRRHRTRDALIELAAVENALAEPGSPEDEERARLETTRDRLRKQLASRS